MSLLKIHGFLGVRSNGFPEAAAALEILLLLLFREAQSGVEHVLWVYEMAERRGGEGGAHFEFASFTWVCSAVVWQLRRTVQSVFTERKGEEEILKTHIVDADLPCSCRCRAPKRGSLCSSTMTLFR